VRCGDLGRIVTLHGEAYEGLPGFGLKFEAYVAKTIAEYVLDNSARGRAWLAERDGRLHGDCAASRQGRPAALGTGRTLGARHRFHITSFYILCALETDLTVV
jgi:hypothetical protein